MRITPLTRRALAIIAEHAPIRPGSFGDLMWPESPARTRSYNCGPNGATRGLGLDLSAGSYLAKLRRAGLIQRLSYHLGYELTSFGRSIVQQTTEADDALG